MVDSLSRSSSFDDGREPYEIVIDKNLRSRAKRAQDDTREELTKVLKRVEHTLVEYERAVHNQMDPSKISSSNIEYLVDINELEEILSDKVAKFKYKQQITVFIVGQSEAIERKNILLAQLNDFFNDQTASFDPKQINATEFDFDLEEVKEEIEDSLETAKIMGNRLEELNENIVQYLIQNSTNKQTKALIERSKKKLEKTLKDTKDELISLAERLQAAQTDLTGKEEKIQTLSRQLDMKTNEVNALLNSKRDQFASASGGNDVGRKDAELHILKTRMKKMDREIKALTKKLNKAGINQIDITDELQEIKVEEKSQQQNKNPNETENSKEDFNYIPDELELKEIDVIKYKYDLEMEMLRKEYEQQLTLTTNKLKQTEAELDKVIKEKIFSSY